MEFYSKNKFERLVHLVGFIIRKEERMLDDVTRSTVRIKKNYSASFPTQSMNTRGR